MEASKEKPTVLVCIKSINILCWDESFHTVRYGTYINERMNEDTRRKGEKKKKRRHKPTATLTYFISLS